MMISASLLWVILGGFLEPVWIIGLMEYNIKKSKIWLVIAIIMMFVSPMCIGFALNDMPVGTAYSIWTGMGATFAMIVGVVLYKDRIDYRKIFFVFLIVVGVVGLHLFGGVA